MALIYLAVMHVIVALTEFFHFVGSALSSLCFGSGSALPARAPSSPDGPEAAFPDWTKYDFPIRQWEPQSMRGHGSCAVELANTAVASSFVAAIVPLPVVQR